MNLYNIYQYSKNYYIIAESFDKAKDIFIEFCAKKEYFTPVIRKIDVIAESNEYSQIAVLLTGEINGRA